MKLANFITADSGQPEIVVTEHRVFFDSLPFNDPAKSDACTRCCLPRREPGSAHRALEVASPVPFGATFQRAKRAGRWNELIVPSVIIAISLHHDLLLHGALVRRHEPHVKTSTRNRQRRCSTVLCMCTDEIAVPIFCQYIAWPRVNALVNVYAGIETVIEKTRVMRNDAKLLEIYIAMRMLKYFFFLLLRLVMVTQQKIEIP